MPKAPNILFIMADDHAAKAIGCYGAGLNKTPHIDRLAKEGMRLNHCYVTNSICTPSRAAILTGTYNHINQVTTLDTHMDNRLPHIAKYLQKGGYQTALVGKWHLGEGPDHEPTGFDYWSVLPGQGEYFDPFMIDQDGMHEERGYVTDIITDKCLNFLATRDDEKPFFLMCHHKAPHRNWEPHPKYRDHISANIPVPASFDDDYSNRAAAASAAKMRIKHDLKYADLGLVQPEGGAEIGARVTPYNSERKIPHPEDVTNLQLMDKHSGEIYRFETTEALAQFKYQRYLKRYLGTIASIDEGVGRLLAYLDDAGLAEDTIIIYTSDQGFFLGEHGWFDKRFIYEDSFQMPFIIRYPQEIKAGSVSDDFACNVDFAPTFLDYANLPIADEMQGRSLRGVFAGNTADDWQQLAYHRYWMHCDHDHNAFAHYGIRTKDYKLIYWYNEALGQEGAHEGGTEPEWELFDCHNDPLELVNCYHDPAYQTVIPELKEALDNKMSEIGDIPRHSPSHWDQDG